MVIDIFKQIMRSFVLDQKKFLIDFKKVRYKKKREATKDQMKDRIEAYTSQRTDETRKLNDDHYNALFKLLEKSADSIQRINYMEFYEYY